MDISESNTCLVERECILRNKEFLLSCIEIFRESVRGEIPNAVDDSILRLFADVSSGTDKEFDTRVKTLTAAGLSESMIVKICPRLDTSFECDDAIRELKSKIDSLLVSCVPSIRKIISSTILLSNFRKKTAYFPGCIYKTTYPVGDIVCFVRMKEDCFITTDDNVDPVVETTHTCDFKKLAYWDCKLLHFDLLTKTILLIRYSDMINVMIMSLESGKQSVLSSSLHQSRNYAYSHQFRKFCWSTNSQYSVVSVDYSNPELSVISTHDFVLPEGYEVYSIGLDNSRVFILAHNRINTSEDKIIMFRGSLAEHEVNIPRCRGMYYISMISDGNIVYVSAKNFIYVVINGVICEKYSLAQTGGGETEVSHMYLTENCLVCEDFSGGSLSVIVIDRVKLF